MPTIGSLGITSANQFGVLFNATETGGDSINVLDLTLKFYTSGGLFLGAIDGEQNFLTSNPGKGVATLRSSLTRLNRRRSTHGC